MSSGLTPLMLNTLNPLANNEQANQPLCIKDALIDRPVTGIGRFLRDRPVSNIQILSLSFHFYFDSECLFSLARNVADERRNRLTGDKAEMLL